MMRSVPVTATVITHNEAANLRAALESLSWADEIVVVDSQSSDHTVAIAREFTDKVTVRPWPGYAEQKNFAASQARHDWIFSLDADERVSPALAEEISTASVSTTICSALRLGPPLTARPASAVKVMTTPMRSLKMLTVCRIRLIVMK